MGELDRSLIDGAERVFMDLSYRITGDKNGNISLEIILRSQFRKSTYSVSLENCQRVSRVFIGRNKHQIIIFYIDTDRKAQKKVINIQ